MDRKNDSGLTKKNVMGIILGAMSLIVGLVLIPQINREADNWAGFVVPFFIVGGVVLVIVFLMLNFKE